MSRYLKIIAICAALVIGPDNLYAKGTWDGEWIGKLEGCGYDQVVRGVVEGSHLRLKLQFTYEEDLKLKLSPSGEIKGYKSIARESEPHITRNYRSFFSGKFSRDYYDGLINMSFEKFDFNPADQVECNLDFAREGTFAAGLIKAGKPLSAVSDPNMRELERLRRENARLNERKEKQQSKPKVVTKRAPKSKTVTTGSGFFVSKNGHVITNQHVVGNCKKVTVGDNAKKQVTADIIETDRRNDLALLKLSTLKMASVETQSLIKKLGVKIVPLASDGLLRSKDVNRGEEIVVAGYPYGEIFGDEIKVNKGIVSGNKGLGGDTGQFQIDAAVQPGNSGGPIYDSNGNIVGVVVSQLNKMKFAKQSGSMPELMNFGIKASTVRQFLSASGLPTKWSKKSRRISTERIAKVAEKQTVMVMCHQ